MDFNEISSKEELRQLWDYNPKDWFFNITVGTLLIISGAMYLWTI